MKLVLLEGVDGLGQTITCGRCIEIRRAQHAARHPNDLQTKGPEAADEASERAAKHGPGPEVDDGVERAPEGG